MDNNQLSIQNNIAKQFLNNVLLSAKEKVRTVSKIFGKNGDLQFKSFKNGNFDVHYFNKK